MKVPHSFLAVFASLAGAIAASGSSEPKIPNVPSYNFSMPLDHFNSSDHRRFNNRYYVNDTYFNPESPGPVFLFDYGENPLWSYYAGVYLAESTGPSAVMQLAKRYHGLAIGWEHRYFGQSLPFPLASSENTPVGPYQCDGKCSGTLMDAPGSYRYMTVEQSLEDAVYFARHFELPGAKYKSLKKSLTADKTPWIWIGGSYPGSRAAWIRIRNPGTFYASWASSAPVQYRVDASSFYNPIERSLPESCRADVHATVKYADEIMDGKYGKEALDRLKKLFYAASQTTTSLDAPYDISKAADTSVTSLAQGLTGAMEDGYQFYGPKKTTDVFCSFMQSYNPNAAPKNKTTPEMSVLSNPGGAKPSKKGLAATYNSSVALDAYIYGYRHRQNALVRADEGQEAPGSPESVTAASWNWMLNNELGLYQGSNPKNISIVSRHWPYTAMQAIYYRILDFNGTKVFGSGPDVSKVNKKYDGWHMNPSNVMFTTGEFDPWRSLSVLSQDTHLGAPQRKLTQDVPACNVAPGKDKVFGVIYPGEVHDKDIEGDIKDKSSPLSVGLDLFSSALNKWLPCFEAKE